MTTNGTIPPVTPAALPAVVGPRSAQVARGEGSSGGNLGTFGVSRGILIARHSHSILDTG